MYVYIAQPLVAQPLVAQPLHEIPARDVWRLHLQALYLHSFPGWAVAYIGALLQ